MFNKKKAKQSEAAADEFFNQDATPTSSEQPNALKELPEQPEWIDQEEEEGQLSVDVYQEGENIIVKSTIAGIEPEDVDISIVNDMLTIRGSRKQEKTHSGREYFFQECYWGAFSRSIILPVEVDVKKIDATIKNGILTIVLPRLQTKTSKKGIKVKDEN
jgi:HSP20 family protein